MANTQSSIERAKRFFDEFIRSECMASFTSDRDADFINDPERAARCYDAAENGADGKTHAEVIGDWRDCLELTLNRRGHEYPERFGNAIHALIDSCEAWHDRNGSLDTQIG